MGHAKDVSHVQPGQFVPGKGLRTLAAAAVFVGLSLFILGLYRDSQRTWHAYLTAYMYWTNLALGGLFFTAIQHVSRAGWSVTIRRFAEAFTAFLPFSAAGGVILLIGSSHLYPWLNAELVSHDALLQGKSGYLNQTFFIIRLCVFFLLWLGFARLLVGHSVAQDTDGSESHTLKNLPASVAFIVVFALSYSFFTVDTLMSLQPHWFSTIWGVYNFAGLFQSTLAMLILFVVYALKRGWLRGLVGEDHLHDLGKFLKAFTIFMAYIGFSQFLLIWYANLPEETIFYIARSNGPWLLVSLGLFVFKFIVPFLALLPRWAKRSPNHLCSVAVLILVMQYVDIYWMVYPNLNSEVLLVSWPELGPFALGGGLFLASVTRFLSNHKLVPVRDPRIEEAIHHHVVY